MPNPSTAHDIESKPDKYLRILEAAIKVFAEQGFHNSTVSQIAREAGVADGTIYLYFKNKDDIMANFFSYKTRLVFDRFREEVAKPGNALERLKNLIRRHLAEFQKDRNMAIVFQTEGRQFHKGEIGIREITKMYLDLVADIIEQGQAEGTIRKDLYIGLVKRFLLGAVDEVINTWVHAGGRYDLTSMTEPLVELYLNGIAPKDESSAGKTR